MLIDTHTHISEEYYDDINLIFENAKKNNVEKIIISCCERNSFEEGIRLLNEYDNLYMTIGFHPDQVNDFKDEDIELLKKYIKKNNKIIGIGEIGLDYHYSNEDSEKQIYMFKKQLDLAKELNLPVVIHTRDATIDTYNILKEYQLKGIYHCFSGSIETANQYINMGYKIGIGGVLTFKNSNLKDVVEKMDLKNIVLETDAPYLSPEPFRGKKNETANVLYVAKKIAEIKNISIEEVANITSNNAISLFDLK